MRKSLLPLAMLLLGTGHASASDFPHAREMFRQLDANGDRAIQFSEIRAARATLFDRLDVNRDGLLDTDEVRAAADRAASRRDTAIASAEDAAGNLFRMDMDWDGRISRHEFSRFVPDRVRRADTNGDDVLSLRELRALRRK